MSHKNSYKTLTNQQRTAIYLQKETQRKALAKHNNAEENKKQMVLAKLEKRFSTVKEAAPVQLSLF